MNWTIHGEIPSMKNTLRRSASGAFYHTDNGVQVYKNNFALQTPRKFKKNLACPVFVSIVVYQKDKRKDFHNCCDLVYDALQYSGVIKNDRLIREWHGAGHIDKKDPRVEITLEVLE